MPLSGGKCIALLPLSSTKIQLQQIHAKMITNSLLFSPPNNLSTLISRYLFLNQPLDSLTLFARAPSSSLSRHKSTFIPLFRACAMLGSSIAGAQLHAQTVKSGISSDAATQTTCIHFYSRCHDINSACKLFDEMPSSKSPITWNAMLTAYSYTGNSTQTFIFLNRMLHESIKPTERTATILLSACSQAKDIILGKMTHGFVCKFTSVSEDCYIGTELVDMYARCGDLEGAGKLFDEMDERNVLTWTAMVSGLAMHGKGKESLDMMDEMVRNGVLPNAVTFTCVLSACCHGGLVEEGVQIFELIEGRFGIKPVVQHYGCMVDLFGRVGLVEEAMEVVRRMPVEPDLIVWRALLSACKVHGKGQIGTEVGKRLLELGKARREKGSRGNWSCEDFVALSNMYALTERWEDVKMVRNVMRRKKVRNIGGSSNVQIKM